MNKTIPCLVCALVSLSHVHATAADVKALVVCNAAETAKVCKDYSPKLNLSSPESDRFLAALTACAGPDNYGQRDDDAHPGRQQRYSDCQDDPGIEALRLKANEVDRAIRDRHSWLEKRCDPSYAKSRVCGTAPDNQIVGSQKREQSSTSKGPMLTSTDPKDAADRMAANQRKADAIAAAAEQERQRKMAQAQADEGLAKLSRDMKDRKRCLANNNPNDCSCSRFFPPSPPTPGVARTCAK